MTLLLPVRTRQLEQLAPEIRDGRVPEEPALGRLGGIGVPTLMLVEQDVPDVHAHSGAIEAAIPGVRRVVLPGSGHLPQLDVPGMFNEVLLDFLAEVSNRA